MIEIQQPHRLVFSFDDPQRLDDPTFEPSVVAFEIESHREIVKLTVTHSALSTTDDLRAMSHGWRAVSANLETLLETGDVLPQQPWEFHNER